MGDQPIDADLLRRMMMGDFSSDSSGRLASKDSTSATKLSKRVEIDLHFEALFPLAGKVEKVKRLPMQLEALAEFITSCQKSTTRYGYAIVGKGEGVLKKAVIQELSRRKLNHSVIADPPYFGNAIKIRIC